MLEIRAEISEAIAHHNLPHAAYLFLELKKLDPTQVLIQAGAARCGQPIGQPAVLRSGGGGVRAVSDALPEFRADRTGGVDAGGDLRAIPESIRDERGNCCCGRWRGCTPSGRFSGRDRNWRESSRCWRSSRSRRGDPREGEGLDDAACLASMTERWPASSSRKSRGRGGSIFFTASRRAMASAYEPGSGESCRLRRARTNSRGRRFEMSSSGWDPSHRVSQFRRRMPRHLPNAWRRAMRR